MNKDLQIAKKIVQTEIKALKKLSFVINKLSENKNTIPETPNKIPTIL